MFQVVRGDVLIDSIVLEKDEYFKWFELLHLHSLV
jgi:hypothetical protein